MIRKAFVMEIHPDKHDEYEQRHNPIWPELARELTLRGASNYSIFLDEQTNQLFAYVEIEDEERWNATAESPIVQKWWAYMKDAMPTNPDNSPLTVALREVFHLD